VQLGPLELADREELLAEWLEEHDVAGAWNLAPALAAAGADEPWCEAVAERLGPESLEPAMTWVASSLSLGALVSELKQSTRRVSDVVGAMKSYSQMDRASLQRVDVKEGLENTLVLLGHRFTDALDVVRSYDPAVPPIEAYPAELNQVWTNLVDNALDAMQGAGTLAVSTWTDGPDVLVEVADSGPGMAPEVAARAFEPFFTTKGTDGKTGLGLDVARRIIEERHGGAITLDSRPGRTVVRVCLNSRLRKRR
jgi:signal transduction histidine kinase